MPVIVTKLIDTKEPRLCSYSYFIATWLLTIALTIKYPSALRRIPRILSWAAIFIIFVVMIGHCGVYAKCEQNSPCLRHQDHAHLAVTGRVQWFCAGQSACCMCWKCWMSAIMYNSKRGWQILLGLVLYKLYTHYAHHIRVHTYLYAMLVPGQFWNLFWKTIFVHFWTLLTRKDAAQGNSGQNRGSSTKFSATRGGTARRPPLLSTLHHRDLERFERKLRNGRKNRVRTD